VNRSDRQIEAAELLRQIVEQAVEGGSEMVEFERVPEGLEITAFAGAMIAPLHSTINERPVAASCQLVANMTAAIPAGSTPA
jgi:hypothetical protein